MSSNEDLAAGFYTATRNDGSIECEGFDSCTFSLQRVSIVSGNPVSKGDRNSWGGQLFSIFVDSTGNGLDGRPVSRNDSVTIGEERAVPRIECKSAGTERGLESDECTFILTTPSGAIAESQEGGG
jgi:hypothetical protein